VLAKKGVVACFPVDAVVPVNSAEAGAADDAVVLRPAKQRVIAAVPEDRIVAAAPSDRIVVVPATKKIDSGTAIN